MKNEPARKEIIQLLKGGAAHAPVKRILKGVLPENMNRRVKEGIPTIWEELEHIRITQLDILEYMFSAAWVSPPWPEGYWPDPAQSADEDMWLNSVSAFNNDLKRAIDLAVDTRLDLYQQIPHGQIGHTYLRELLLIADHNAYHLAKIVFMRKLFSNW